MQPDSTNLKPFVLAFIKGKELGVLATINQNGEPEAATVGFYVDDDFNFLVLAKSDSRKVVNISLKNKVALVIGTTEGLNTVQIQGEARIIKPGDQEFADKIVQVSSIKPLYFGPLLKIEGSDYVIIHIKSTWVRWLEFNVNSRHEDFIQIL